MTGANWRKSNYSNGTNCIEVAASAEQAQWVKSRLSFSNGNCTEIAAWRESYRCEGGACVEVGQGPTVVGVRDSKDPDGAVLAFGSEQWERFTSRLRADD